MTNEAAKRLRRMQVAAVKGMDRFWDSEDGDSDALADAMTALRRDGGKSLQEALAAAKAEGAREAVERIRARIEQERVTVGIGPAGLMHLRAILDEEAAR